MIFFRLGNEASLSVSHAEREASERGASECGMMGKKGTNCSLRRSIQLLWWLFLCVEICDGECTYNLTFTPTTPCTAATTSAKAVSVLVELGNEAQEFVLWGQADLRHSQHGCAESHLRLESESNCMQGVCQLRLIRFLGSSSSEVQDWCLATVGVQMSDGQSSLFFNITRPIPLDGQISVGSCISTEEDEYNEEDEVGDVDWS